MKVLSIPHIDQLSNSESGIHTVVRYYHHHAPEYDIQFVTEADDFELVAIHAGMGKSIQPVPIVAHLHGLYWTADYAMPNWAYRSNQHIVDVIRHADQISVPSNWVAETLQRDMHISPHVLPHGVDWKSWQHDIPREGYVIGYAKNRAGMDVCDPSFLAELAPRFPKLRIYATFAPPINLPNVTTTGVLPYRQMRQLVQGASVFISTTKETWGVAMLEAMAAGVPVLAYRHGGAAELVAHGVNGYLAQPDNIDDLAQGLNYCLQHSLQLGANGREIARAYSWEAAMRNVAEVYKLAVGGKPPTVAVVIPAYNKDRYLERAVQSAREQTHPVTRIIIVDNNSTDNTGHVGRSLAASCPEVEYVNEPLQGVAYARNAGIGLCDGIKYICCLDADDWIDHRFIEACVNELEGDRSLGLAYTGLTWHREDGASGNSKWPEAYDYDQQLKRRNQVPTCCVFRRDLWERSGGYRQRYAPDGAGSEDAELWTRFGSLGFGGKKVTDAGLFHYQYGGQVSSNPNYHETDWLGWHPWVKDGFHPFASVAKPYKPSHPVRMYDEPTVSVIIPVGKGHHQYLVDALDSLEAQTYRKWEVIIVDDSGEDYPRWLSQAYPFVRLVRTPGGLGAGAARNKGAEIARGYFYLFLDADDWLYPDCLDRMLNAWGQTGQAIYSDYIGIAKVADVSSLADNLRRDLLDWNPSKQRATIRYRAANYDQEKMKSQPSDPPYLWCNITTLIPATWHHEIGGFDENMVSWEDVDYWHRMAWMGKGFFRITEPLLVYRFDTGSRRETGRQQWSDLLDYMRSKKV